MVLKVVNVKVMEIMVVVTGLLSVKRTWLMLYNTWETRRRGFNAIIKSIDLVCFKSSFVLFDPGFTFSYMSSYFSSFFDVAYEAFAMLLYDFTLIGYSLVVDRAVSILCGYLCRP